jgi:hypothetical protein
MKIRLFALSFTSLLALALGSACTVKTVGTGGSGNTGNTGTGNNGNTGNVAAVCGNGTCEVNEDSTACPEDCFDGCGDGVCDTAEDGGNCPARLRARRLRRRDFCDNLGEDSGCRAPRTAAAGGRLLRGLPRPTAASAAATRSPSPRPRAARSGDDPSAGLPRRLPQLRLR